MMAGTGKERRGALLADWALETGEGRIYPDQARPQRERRWYLIQNSRTPPGTHTHTHRERGRKGCGRWGLRDRWR